MGFDIVKLTTQQEQALNSYLAGFLSYGKVINDGKEWPYEEFDRLRAAAIPDLAALLNSFLKKTISLKKFKETSEILCRKHPYWGFKNFSGQMQLNQYANNIPDPDKEEILREAMVPPKLGVEAKDKINSVYTYLKQLKAKTENPKSIPRPTLAYMLSYFWEILSPNSWPVFYGSTKKALLELGFDLESQPTHGDEFLAYIECISAVSAHLERQHKKKEPNLLWFAEHVLWWQFNNASAIKDETKSNGGRKNKLEKEEGLLASPESSWIPPIISDLAELAENQETPWSKRLGVRPEKAFETKLRYVFTIMGYDVTELGQGTGREPDGVAVTLGVRDGDYALVYDAKARGKEYGLGTDDRSIIDYIRRKQEELRKQRINRLSFVIVSSAFSENEKVKESLVNIFRMTRVPVIMVSAQDLLYLTELKLKDADIDFSRLETLFLETGVLIRERIFEVLGS